MHPATCRAIAGIDDADDELILDAITGAAVYYPPEPRAVAPEIVAPRRAAELLPSRAATAQRVLDALQARPHGATARQLAEDLAAAEKYVVDVLTRLKRRHAAALGLTWEDIGPRGRLHYTLHGWPPLPWAAHKEH